MSHSLLFIPDISGYTNFIQTTEVEHSQHVISELLEILIDANISGFELAEIEGDALFFYKENEVISSEMLLAQAETMFTAFYSHLKLLETNRICPCKACASAPALKLKIISHCGELQFISVKGTRKPFGAEVIEVHRLMKNSVPGDNYLLISKNLETGLGLPENYKSKLFEFVEASDHYDGKDVFYSYSFLDPDKLNLKTVAQIKDPGMGREHNIKLGKEMPVSAHQLYEYLSNYRYRKYYSDGVDEIIYDESEVSRVGSEHKCVIKGSDLDFVTITKKAEPGQLVYGEYTTSPAPVDELFQYFIISPIDENRCLLELEVYWTTHSIFKKLIMATVGKFGFKKNVNKTFNKLEEFVRDPEKAMAG